MWDSVIVLVLLSVYFVSNISFAIILMGKRELVTLLCLSSWCLLIFMWQFVIVVFPDHTHYRDMSDMLTASVGKLWTLFTKHLSDLMHAHIPAKTLKGRKMKRPWIDRKNSK